MHINYHNKYALRNNQIGIIQLWSWANCFRFINFETEKVYEIPLDKIDSLFILTKEEFNKLYKERNKPSNLFLENGLFIGNKLFYSNRQISYGLIHDNILNSYEKQTNTYWTKGFCMAVAYAISTYSYIKEILEIDKDITKIDKEVLKTLLYKYHMAGDNSDMYSIILNRFGLNDGIITITEEEIRTELAKIKTLPYKHKKSILNSEMVKSVKKEFNSYL